MRLSRPYASLVMADNAFSVSAPKIWNDLSFNRRTATYVSSFKRNLKRELFYTARTLITPSNSRLSRLRFRFFWLGLIAELQICFVFVFVMRQRQQKGSFIRRFCVGKVVVIYRRLITKNVTFSRKRRTVVAVLRWWICWTQRVTPRSIRRARRDQIHRQMKMLDDHMWRRGSPALTDSVRVLSKQIRSDVPAKTFNRNFA